MSPTSGRVLQGEAQAWAWLVEVALLLGCSFGSDADGVERISLDGVAVLYAVPGQRKVHYVRDAVSVVYPMPTGDDERRTFLLKHGAKTH